MESDDLKKDLPLMPPPPDSSSMKLTIKEIWFSFAAPTNVRSPSQAISRWDCTHKSWASLHKRFTESMICANTGQVNSQ